MSGALLQAASAAESVTLSDENVGYFTITDPAFVGYRLESDGDILETRTSGNTDIGNWISPKGAAPSSYQVRATLNSGTLTGGSSATGSWLALTSNREWAISQSGIGTKTAQITVEIRKGTGAVVATATIDLSVEVTP